MKNLLNLIFFILVFFFLSDISGKNLIPPPSQNNDSLSDLHAKAKKYSQQFYELNAFPFGLSLDIYTGKEENRKIITDFLKQDNGFKEYSGKHPFDVIDGYGEHGDLGMFGGFATVATAYEYIYLRDFGGKEEEIKIARERLIRAINSWHIFTDITGGKGGIARGIMRIKPENPSDPPIPGGIPETIPLFDEKGNPLPEKKHAVWRKDMTGKYPDWIWLDDTSKDQIDGFIFALGVLWDAVVSDSEIHKELKDTLQDDAVKIAKKLMEKVDYNGEMLDLIIIDADGRKVAFHDLNPRIFEGFVFPEDAELQNGFNALLALHVIRTLYHVSGNEEIGKYYYEDLFVKRKFPDHIKNTLTMMYTGTLTNYSNVNMAATAFYSLLRYESDDQVFSTFQDLLESQFYSPNLPRQPKGLKQSFFDFIYGGFKKGETDQTAVEDGIETLNGFVDPPYYNVEVINCDEQEIANKKCVAVDGKTNIKIMDGKGHGGTIVAEDVLPKKIRPPSNFECRSDPHNVNGGGGSTLNPGGDFLGAYWIGRILVDSKDTKENRSPYLRPSYMPVEPQPEEIIEVMDEGFIEIINEDVIETAKEEIVQDIAQEQEIKIEEESKKGNGGGCSAGSRIHGSFTIIYLLILADFICLKLKKGRRIS